MVLAKISVSHKKGGNSVSPLIAKSDIFDALNNLMQFVGFFEAWQLPPDSSGGVRASDSYPPVGGRGFKPGMCDVVLFIDIVEYEAWQLPPDSSGGVRASDSYPPFGGRGFKPGMYDVVLFIDIVEYEAW